MQSVADSFVFKTTSDAAETATYDPEEDPQEIFIEVMDNVAGDPAPTPVYEGDLILGAAVDPMTDDMLLF